jgi:hypothetical protein
LSSWKFGGNPIGDYKPPFQLWFLALPKPGIAKLVTFSSEFCNALPLTGRFNSAIIKTIGWKP